MIKILRLFILALALMQLDRSILNGAALQIYPAPQGEELSSDYTVKVDGKEVPVYVARIAPAETALRWQAMDDKTNSAKQI